MSLSGKQVLSLLGKVISTEEDAINCDQCLSHLAEFAETELAGQDVPEALEAIAAHLRQCECCRDEYDALLEGLRAIEETI